MQPSKWWKCDLQVATPAFDFTLPGDEHFDLNNRDSRSRFLDRYMGALQAKGVEVIVLADHNTGSWIDDVKEAGNRHGVVVFPGCEMTTHTGADGVHLIIVGGLETTTQDFDRLIHGPLGYDADHPPFVPSGRKQTPGTSRKTVVQVLDDLPDGYLAIAPHALNENGIASKATVVGDMRVRAMQHERLVAIDPGDCSAATGDGFGDQLRRRELTNSFPRLPDLAFVSTSDAYSLEGLGCRFAWIRMGEPTLEALRQAFLDHESRILCDWSPRLTSYQDRNPNATRHPWISSLQLSAGTGGVTCDLDLQFHPNLNVVIGGRGSGKSTVVAALRQLYSDTETLPGRLKDDAKAFVETVLGTVKTSSIHVLQESQARQQAVWHARSGSRSIAADGTEVATSFGATVINQKELFERAAGDKSDANVSSRSLLSLLDGGIGYLSTNVHGLDSFARRTEDARFKWVSSQRFASQLKRDQGQLAALRQKATTVRAQVAAFSSDEVKARLARIDDRRREREVYNQNRWVVNKMLSDVTELSEQVSNPLPTIEASPPYTDALRAHSARLDQVLSDLGQDIARAVDSAREAMRVEDELVTSSEWSKDADAAAADLVAYNEDLSAKGLSPSEFQRLQTELQSTETLIRKLEDAQPHVATAEAECARDWSVLMQLMEERRSARQAVLTAITERSGRLRFVVYQFKDVVPWIESLRAHGNFRSDAYLDDVPALARWLWTGTVEVVAARHKVWMDALVIGNMSSVRALSGVRQALCDRLSELTDDTRLRVGSEMPDDVVRMSFLREGGVETRETDWKLVSEGSPGQRTAAMLAFVLHHGTEPLVLDQPEDDLDSEWIAQLVVKELRKSRWTRQLIVVTHNANIPVLGDAEQVIALENHENVLRIRRSGSANAAKFHCGPVEDAEVRCDIQNIMEGGIPAFMRRERKYHNEVHRGRPVAS